MNNGKIEKIKDVEMKLNVIHKQILELKSYLDKKHGKGEAEDLRNFIKLYEEETALQKELNDTKKEIEYKELYNEIINSTVPTIDQLQRLLVLKAEILTDKYPRLSKDLVTKVQFNHYKDIWEILNDKDIKDLLEEEDVKTVISKVVTEVDYEFNEPPSKTTITIDKISDQLRQGNIGYGQYFPLKMESKGQSKEITTLTMVEREDVEDFIPDNINHDDVRTMNAVMTIYHSYKKDRASLNDIYRVKVGDSKANPNKRQREELKRQLIALSRTYITIDYTDELNNFNYEGLDSGGKYGGHILDLHYFTGKKKGNETTIFKIHGVSPLFQYALAKKQIIDFPFKDRQNTLTKTLRVQQLEEYLFKRIKQMKNPNNRMGQNRNDILVDTIIKNIDFVYKSKKAESNARTKLNQDTEEILKGFKREGVIKDYDPIGKGRRKFYKWRIVL